MSKKIYARVENDVVVELLETTGDIEAMFHKGLQWLDVTDVSGIANGWRYDGLRFTATGPSPDPAE